jgi:hypothetical protein
MVINTICLLNLLGNMLLNHADYTQVFEDKTACIERANHVCGGLERAKRIDISKHFAQEAVENGHMSLY